MNSSKSRHSRLNTNAVVFVVATILSASASGYFSPPNLIPQIVAIATAIVLALSGRRAPKVDASAPIEKPAADISPNADEIRGVMRMLCHDIANPLTVVVGNIELALSMADESDPILSKALKKAMRATESQRDILAQAKYFHELAGRGRPLKLMPTSLGSIVAGVLQSCAEVLADRSISVIYDKDALARSIVAGDPVCLDTVVIRSLFVLAIKTMDTGGTIRISVSEEEDLTQLVMQDDGMGLDPDDIERMFDLGSAGRDDKNRPGVSLGVALSKRLINLLGGSIHITSVPDGEPGHGTTYRMTFKRHKQIETSSILRAG